MREHRSRRLDRFPIVAAAVSLLAGCAAIGVADVSSPFYHLPATTTVAVRQTITIPPGTAHVTLQDGRVVTIDHLRRYEPYCEFEVNDVVETEQQVRPGRFAAVRIIRQQLIGAADHPSLLAANTITEDANGKAVDSILMGALDDVLRLSEVQFRLRSPNQKNVRELRCTGGWAFTSNVAFPTLIEMQRALEPLLSIEIE